MWALASHKSFEMYVQLFWDIAKLLPTNKKLRFTVDFEEKLIAALKFIFDCEICGCLYHFSECLLRKAQKLGLISHSFEEETRQVIKELKKFCFSDSNLSVILNEKKNSYKEKLSNLTSSSLEKNALDYYKGKRNIFLIQVLGMIDFLDYFIKQWLPKYEQNIINYSKINEKERTNNALESYHGHLQSKLTK